MYKLSDFSKGIVASGDADVWAQRCPICNELPTLSDDCIEVEGKLVVYVRCTGDCPLEGNPFSIDYWNSMRFDVDQLATYSSEEREERAPWVHANKMVNLKQEVTGWLHATSS